MGRKAMRKPAVLGALGWSNSTLYSKISQGKFPKPVKLDPTLGSRKVRPEIWPESPRCGHRRPRQDIATGFHSAGFSRRTKRLSKPRPSRW
jgi:predicted DNA-binding transcriptional regulator AlpA